MFLLTNHRPKLKTALLLTLILSGSLWITACGSDSNSTSNNESIKQNSNPIADAGTDQNVSTGSVVTLSAAASTDADGDSLSYQWALTAIPSSSTALLSDTTAVAPTFTADKDGIYTAQLIVNDGTVDSTPVTVTITAATANSAPTANAGANQNVETGSFVTLDASASSDPDGDTLSYQWSLTAVPNSSSALLDSTSAVTPTFTADKDGTYIAQLIVNDGTVNSTPVSVTITATTSNAKPVANAGADLSVEFPFTVYLDGSASTDADGDGLSYTWAFVSKPAVSSATLDNAQVVSPSFTADVEGSYVLSLVVNDGTVDSDADTITIIASEPNIATAANPGADRTVSVGSNVLLDGSASSDANGDALTYSWEFTAVPSSSRALLDSSIGLQTGFTADVAGVYTIKLIVNDGKVDSAPAILTITAN